MPMMCERTICPIAARSGRNGVRVPEFDYTPLVFIGVLLIPGLIASLIGGGSDE